MSKECRRPGIKLLQWRSRAPLIFRPKWGLKGRKKFFGDRPPLSQALDDRPTFPYLKVWIRYSIVYRNLTTRTVWQQLCKCLNVEFRFSFNDLLKDTTSCFLVNLLRNKWLPLILDPKVEMGKGSKVTEDHSQVCVYKKGSEIATLWLTIASVLIVS